ncbi:hypothetical protein BpHYR1_034130, partial [Brachionus plicatilis]
MLYSIRAIYLTIHVCIKTLLEGLKGIVMTVNKFNFWIFSVPNGNYGGQASEIKIYSGDLTL